MLTAQGQGPKIKINCHKHPTYLARREPTADCPVCREMWWRATHWICRCSTADPGMIANGQLCAICGRQRHQGEHAASTLNLMKKRAEEWDTEMRDNA